MDTLVKSYSLKQKKGDGNVFHWQNITVKSDVKWIINAEIETKGMQ